MVTSEPTSMLGKIAGYVEILSRDPHSTVFVPLAEAYRQMGLLDDALEVARKGTAALPKFSPGYTSLGRIHAQRQELSEAEATFRQALELDPQSVPTLKGLARVYGIRGQKEQARGLLERARQLRPDDTAVAKMLAALGPAPAVKPASSISSPAAPSPGEIAATEAEDVQAPIATATIAEIYVKQGMLSKAVQVYRGLLVANPGNATLETRYQELVRQMQGGVGPRVAAEPVVTPSVAAAPVPKGSDDQTLATLMRWLDAIRDRRDDVR